MSIRRQVDGILMSWKDLYASDILKWHSQEIDGKQLLYRRQGIVENLFDIDGTDFEGRADLHVNPTIKIDLPLSDAEIRYRINLAWACMRHIHPLLSCKALYRDEFLPGQSRRSWLTRYFVYERPQNLRDVLDNAAQHITFVQDFYKDVDTEDFFLHLTNTARAIDEKESLSRLIVMPFQRTQTGSLTASMFIVAGHQVADGLTTFRWMLSLIDLLYTDPPKLLDRMFKMCGQDNQTILSMPPAQESLYPVYSTSSAKDRWNWIITRILRHVHHPPPAAFQNPLRREVSLCSTEPMPRKYPKILNYDKLPPLNGNWIAADLSQRATDNLSKMCKQAGISVGSGAFTLVGMIMMRFEEAREPDVPHWKRLPFVGSFPVNPRPFLTGDSTTGKENSLMLAFSDGVVLPFIPSDCDLIKTFRVLGRLAHRQLRQYQKRRRTPAEEAHLGSRSPRELLPALYLSTLERLEGRVNPERRAGVNPQGAYPARHSPTLATCGISSVGSRAALAAAGRQLDDGTIDAHSYLIDSRASVRPRDGEFLVGSTGAPGSMQFRASYDGSAIDPQKAQAWKEAILSILEFDMEAGVHHDVIKRQSSTTGRLSKL